jgi:hypothetical protein
VTLSDAIDTDLVRDHHCVTGWCPRCGATDIVRADTVTGGRHDGLPAWTERYYHDDTCRNCDGTDVERCDEDEALRRDAVREDAVLEKSWRDQIANGRLQGMAYEATWREGVLEEALATMADRDEVLREAIARVIAERDAEEDAA